MNRINRIRHWFSLLYQPRKLADAFMMKFPLLTSDRTYIECLWRSKMNYPLNLKNPRTFNEKLQWLKLYDRRPIYTTMVDKFAVKEYVANLIGKKYVIPTLGVWDKTEDVEWDKLPNQFVLKCTHDSGGLVICKDKKKLDIDAAIKKLNKSLHYNYYMAGREWPYKNVPRRIIAEEFMTDKHGELRDYKFFCFDGKVKFFKIDFDRQTCHRANYYDRDGNLLYFGEKVCPPDYEKQLEIPICIEQMINTAEQIALKDGFVRVDLYNIDKKILFGELTLYPGSGFGEFEPDEWDKTIGAMINLPVDKIP